MDALAKTLEFIGKALPLVVALFEAHDRDEARAIAALEAAFLDQRKVNDARLAAKVYPVPGASSRAERADEITAEVPLPKPTRPR